MRENKEVVPFDSFSAVYKVLIWVGFYKLDKRVKKWKKILYEFYRRLAIIIVIVFSLQFLVYTLQSRDDIQKITVSLMINIIEANLCVKVLTVFFLVTRLQNLNEFLKNGTFCTANETDQKILQKNVIQMYRLCLILNINTTIATCFWGFRSVLKRYVNGEYEVVPMYIPYRTDTIFRFFLLFVNVMGPMFWVGYGHTSIDVLIATYYAQAHTQLKIIRQQLKNIVDDTQNDRDNLKYGFQYKDISDKAIKERFVSIVKRYESLLWYVKEVDSIFNVALSFQFLSSAVAVCFVTYCITIATSSFEIIFMVSMFIFLTTQIFLYCVFGNFVFIESQFINFSLYESDWLSLSPSFRRLLLIAMVMWSRPVVPQVFKILQVSLATFVAIIKSSYTLYTVLKIITNNDKDK